MKIKRRAKHREYRNEALAFAIILLCFGGVLFLRANSVASITGMAIAAGSANPMVNIKIDHGAGQESNYAIPVNPGMTGMDALKAVAVIKMEQGQIACIDSVCNSVIGSWKYSVNGILMTEDAFLGYALTGNEQLWASFVNLI